MVASASAFTVMLSVSELPQEPGIVYVITKVPAPAEDGSKVPAKGSVIPPPDHVPPGSTAVNVTGILLSQNGPAGAIVASKLELICTSNV